MSDPLEDDLEHILAHTRGLWDRLRGKRLFITGGTGFFGRWLLESLAWARRELALDTTALVLTRDPESFKRRAPHLVQDRWIQLWPGDVRTFEFPPGRFDMAVHAATTSSAVLNDEDPRLMFETIVEGTRRTLDFARQSGVGALLFTSSGAVYGEQPPFLTHVTEEHIPAPPPFSPHSAYAEGKRIAELMCSTGHRASGLEPKIARCFAFVGPHLPLDRHFAVGNFIRDGLAGGPVKVQGDGTPYRSYLYAADLAIWLWTILLLARPCRPYNVGASEGVTIEALARMIAARCGVAVHVARDAIPGAPAQRYVPSTQRAEDELGLRAWIRLEEALDRTIRWHRLGLQQLAPHP